MYYALLVVVHGVVEVVNVAGCVLRTTRQGIFSLSDWCVMISILIGLTAHPDSRKLSFIRLLLFQIRMIDTRHLEHSSTALASRGKRIGRGGNPPQKYPWPVYNIVLVVWQSVRRWHVPPSKKPDHIGLVCDRNREWREDRDDLPEAEIGK
jgi:hypothetical protein